MYSRRYSLGNTEPGSRTMDHNYRGDRSSRPHQHLEHSSIHSRQDTDRCINLCWLGRHNLQANYAQKAIATHERLQCNQ